MASRHCIVLRWAAAWKPSACFSPAAHSSTRQTACFPARRCSGHPMGGEITRIGLARSYLGVAPPAHRRRIVA